MKKVISIVALVLMSVVNPASAYEMGKTYFGVGYHMGMYDNKNLPKANISALKLEGGKYVTDTVAVVGQLGIGMSSDTVSSYYGDIDIEMTTAMAIFMKGDLPLSNAAKLYGLIGFARGELKASGSGGSISDNDSGLSYGFGVDVNISNDMAISAEYVMYLHESDYDYDGFNITFKKYLF